MNEQLLEQAKAFVDDYRLLINGAAKRAGELARGARPLVPLTPGAEVEFLDIALQEIVDGKIRINPPVLGDAS